MSLSYTTTTTYRQTVAVYTQEPIYLNILIQDLAVVTLNLLRSVNYKILGCTCAPLVIIVTVPKFMFEYMNG